MREEPLVEIECGELEMDGIEYLGGNTIRKVFLIPHRSIIEELCSEMPQEKLIKLMERAQGKWQYPSQVLMQLLQVSVISVSVEINKNID